MTWDEECVKHVLMYSINIRGVQSIFNCHFGNLCISRRPKNIGLVNNYMACYKIAGLSKDDTIWSVIWNHHSSIHIPLHCNHRLQIVIVGLLFNAVQGNLVKGLLHQAAGNEGLSQLVLHHFLLLYAVGCWHHHTASSSVIHGVNVFL